MRYKKVILVVGYLLLFYWWVTIQLFRSDPIGSLRLYSICVFFYFVVSGLVLFTSVSKLDMYIKAGLMCILLGVVSFGALRLAEQFVFINTPEISLRIFGLVHMIPYFLFLYGLLHISEERSGYSIPLTKVAVFAVILFPLSLLASGALEYGVFDLMRFLVLYLPLQYLSLVAISAMVLLRRYYDEGSIRWFLLLTVGLAAVLVACLLFFYELLVGSPFSPGAEVFLQLIGFFLVLVAVSGIPDAYDDLFLGKHTGITYFRDVVYKTTVDLN